MDVKVEFEQILLLCHGCLSSDRKLSRVTGQEILLFYKLRGDVLPSNKDLMLCWECVSTIHKLIVYQTRIRLAQEWLSEYAVYNIKNGIPQTLSHLKTAYQTNIYNLEIIYNASDKITQEIQLKKNETIDNIKILEDDKILADIKRENEEELNNICDIKEEYNNNDDDNDFIDNSDINDIELKVESPKNNKVKGKVKKKVKQKPSFSRRYEKYATITKSVIDFNEQYQQFCEEIQLSYEEYEDYLNVRLRKHFGYARLKYKCKECAIGYKKQVDLLRHNAILHDKKPFPHRCPACRAVLQSPSDAREHWRALHTRMFRCALCAEHMRTARDLKRHLYCMHGHVYSCHECPKTYTSLREFSAHYQRDHERCQCDYCGKTCASKRFIERHILRRHLPALCQRCGRTFTNHVQYAKHARMFHPDLLQRAVVKEMCYCVECDLQFQSVDRYKRHLNQSVKHKPKKKLDVPCPACGKIFARKTYMNNHYRLFHMNSSKYYCELCNKYFANGYGLRTHVARVHEKQRMPKDKMCDICGRGFATNRILVNHRRTHTGERPFKCAHCPASFAQKTAMKTHAKTQHKDVLLTDVIGI